MSAPQDGYAIEYPALSTRYLLPPEHPTEKARAVALATALELSEDGITVDGQPFPWHVYRVPVQVDDLGQGFRAVYLPILVEGEVLAGAGVREASLGELLANDPPPAVDPEDERGQAPAG